MSKKIMIRIRDFYKDAIGEVEYTYVSEEVYEALVDTFRKEAHAEVMRNLRHVTKDGYVEGDTENQKERLQLYFFEGLTYRQTGENWESVINL